MKALFYTATAVFITFAGVIAYFALQSPASVGGARVVLDIDAGSMPDMPDANKDKAAFDPYPGAEEDKPAAEATGSAAPAPDTEPPTASAEPTPPPEETVAAHESPVAPPAAQEKAPEPPPGTALAGLDHDRPLFREVAPDPAPAVTAAAEPAPAAIPTPSAAPTPAPADAVAARDPVVPDPAAGASLMQSQPATQPEPEPEAPPAAAADAPAPRDAAPSTAPAPATPTPAEIAAIMQDVEAHAPPAPPPPPVPVRRPNGIPAPGEQVAAAGGWAAGVQYGTAESAAKTARVAILLRNVGRLDPDNADAIGSLPSAISLGFWPYAPEGKRLASRAQEKGHEIIVQLPLEPADYPASNAGPDSLLTTATPEQNAQRLDAVLSRFEGSSGVTNLMGGKMLQSKAALKPLLEELKTRGLIYVGENQNSHTTLRQIAREVNLRFGAAEVMIDAQPAPEAIDKALARLVGIAKQRGNAIGIGNATVVTVQQVHEWADTLAAQGITLVPVGALTQTPGSS
jgi:uncharacterized protein